MAPTNTGNLFDLDNEPQMFSFDLPEIESEDKTVLMSVAQLKRIIGLAAIIITTKCKFSQVILAEDEGVLEGISFLLTGKTDRLKVILDQMYGDEGDDEDETSDTHDSA